MSNLGNSVSYAISTNGKYQDKTGSAKGMKMVSFSSVEELRRIAQKDWSPCLFENGNRNKESFESSSFLYADVDEGCSIEKFGEVFSGVEYFILTSRNHQKTKPGTKSKPESPAQDRYHVIFPLEHVCFDSAELDRGLAQLTDKYDFLDRSVKDSARFFFGFDGVEVFHHAGENRLACADQSYLELPTEPLREAKEKQILDSLKSAGVSGLLNEYADWIAIGTALKNEGYTFDNWVEISNPDVDVAEMQRKWDGFAKHGTTNGTLVHFARMANPGLLLKGERLESAVLNRPKPVTTERDVPVLPQTPFPAIKSYSGTVHQQFDCDQFGNVARVMYYHGADYRYVQDHKSWVEWTGTNWRHSEDGEGGNIKRVIKEVIAQIKTRESHFYPAGDTKGSDEEKKAAEAFKKFHAFVVNCKNAHHVEGVEKLLRNESAMATTEKDYDANPMRFNCKNGTIDLNNGALLPHDREDLCTKIGTVEYKPGVGCPSFEKMLLDVMCGRQDLVNFLQEYFGYMLTGLPPDRIMVIFWGSGANGKSSVVNIIKEVMGDYLTTARTETFTQSDKIDKIGQDTVLLKSARGIIMQETTEGQRLDVQKIKGFTGKDTIKGRFNFSRSDIEFVNTGKLILATNHKPTIKGDDDAAWDRVCLVPFERVFKDSERDTGLPDRIINEELSGVLNWMLAGLERLRNRKFKFIKPSDVSKATNEYRREEDKMGQFIEEYCTYAGESWVGATPEVDAKTIYGKYKEWAEESGLKPVAQVRFLKELSQGRPWIQKFRNAKGMVYTGIRLRKEDEEFISKEEAHQRQETEQDTPF